MSDQLSQRRAKMVLVVLGHFCEHPAMVAPMPNINSIGINTGMFIHITMVIVMVNCDRDG